MMPNRRRSSGFRPLPPRSKPANDDLFGNGDDDAEKGRDHLFLWTVGILLLVGMALAAWLGAFYIYGHPEKPESYRLLQKFKKVPQPKRFELTEAPPGEFLTPQKAFERYGAMTDFQLGRENEVLMRDFIRNYRSTKRLVPYLVGRYTIMSSYGLKEGDFIDSGMVAVAQSVDVPQVVIEHLYPAEKAVIPTLEQMLSSGLDLKLDRTTDLAAVIHIGRMPDGRLQFTLVPLIYGSYALAQRSESFRLEPPSILNPGGGLPVVRDQLLEDCLKRYAETIRERNAKLAAQRKDHEIPVAVPAEGTTIVQLPVPPPEQKKPEEPKETAAAEPTPAPEVAVAAATPAPTPAATPVPEPTPEKEVTAAATPARSPLLQPFLAASPTPSADASSRPQRWKTYSPGQMPRGRLVTLEDASALADRGVGGERLYLRGDFAVTASRDNRVVLRSSNSLDQAHAPVAVVEFPENSTVPSERQRFSRDGMRPFEVRDVQRRPDGRVTIYVREITTP